MTKTSFIPWIITLLLGVYVFALTHHARTRSTPPPIYDFYDTTVVMVQIHKHEGNLDVLGRFNNIVEGKKQTLASRPIDEQAYKVVFKVNSPRPAMIYVDDAPLEVFLQPDSGLHVDIFYNKEENLIDSAFFKGATADICNYYFERSRHFEGQQLRAKRHILGSEDLGAYAQQLDSFAGSELEFLAQYTQVDSLPDWFVDFETNEIIYHKGYLKLSQAFNQETPQTYFDELPVNKEEAVFSYYYYLYLNAHIQHIDKTDLTQMDPRLRGEVTTLHRMSIADTMLIGEPHDVFLTRMIFQHMRPEEFPFANRLIDQYRSKFNQKKYRRFLFAQLDSLRLEL